MSLTTYTVGQQIRLTATFANISGTLTDCTVSLTVRTPDGTETVESANVVHDSTGTYHYDYTAPTGVHGVIEYRWTASGALTGAQEGSFLVLPSDF